MWALTRLFKKSERDDLIGLKTVRVNGHTFRIRKINPFVDFEANEIPQIFTYFMKRRKAEPPPLSDQQIKRGIEDMMRTVKVGVVEPKLGPEILTVEDIFRWGDTGAKLYLEILAHSLNQFRGVQGVFFSIKIRRSLYTQWRSGTASFQST